MVSIKSATIAQHIRAHFEPATNMLKQLPSGMVTVVKNARTSMFQSLSR